MNAPEPDFGHPNRARLLDYFAGGVLHFAADRDLAAALEAAYPKVGELVRANRQFVLKAVRWACAIKGIRQVIDLGGGLPSKPSVHDVARQADPEVAVAYVDWDPVVVRHVLAAAKASGWHGTAVAEADASDPAEVLSDPAVASIIDMGRPAAFVLGGTLSSMTAGVARDAVAGYAAAAAAGSVVIVSCASYADWELAERQAKAFAVAGTWVNHGEDGMTSWFEAGGLRLMHGRVMDTSCWPACPVTPRPDTAEACVLGGIGIKD